MDTKILPAHARVSLEQILGWTQDHYCGMHRVIYIDSRGWERNYYAVKGKHFVMDQNHEHCVEVF